MTRRIFRSSSLAALTIASGLSLSSGSASAIGTTPDAYVVSGSTAVVIDTVTRGSVGAVAIGSGAADIAFSADGTLAGIVSSSANTLTLIATATNLRIGVVSTGASPTALALSPDGSEAFVGLSNGSVQRLDLGTGTVTATYPFAVVGDLAISPDGSRLFVAGHGVHAIDLASGDVTTWSYGPSANASRIAVSPDGTRGYVVFDGWMSSTLLMINLNSGAIVASPGFGPIPGSMALSPDGTRLYLGVRAIWADTGYAAGFFPGRTVSVLDTTTARWVGQIDLGSAGSNWTMQNTGSGIAVTPDGDSVFIGVPRLNSVLVVRTSTNAIVGSIPTMSPGVIGIEPDPSAIPVLRVVDAVDDGTTVTTLGGSGGNVVGNDTVGAFPAAGLATVEQLDGLGIAIDSSGAVAVDAGLSVGAHTATYRLCEQAVASNCDEATLTVTVDAPPAVQATDDSGSALPGLVAVPNVLGNDTLDGQSTSLASVRLTQLSSTDSGVGLNSSTGAVAVASGTSPTTATVRYRVCERANLSNCDDAEVAISVLENPIVAVADDASASRAGTTSAINVLANDWFLGLRATPSSVVMHEVGYTGAAVRLNTSTGDVSVAASAPMGVYQVEYRICERLVASNCDSAMVTIDVGSFILDAVDDSGRGSSKQANRIMGNVLANDVLGLDPATLATVTLDQVSSTSPQLVLDPDTGSVVVTGRTSSGSHLLVYRICDRTAPTICDTAKVRVELSGRR